MYTRSTAVHVITLAYSVVAFGIACAPAAIAQPSAGSPVTLKAPDGITLKATDFNAAAPGAALPAILLLHQCNRDRGSWSAFASGASARGFRVLSLDFRGYGESEGQRFANFQEQQPIIAQKWPADVDAALAWLESQPGVDKSRVGIAAASCGVNQAVLAASRHPEVRTLVLLSGGTTAEGRDYLRKANSMPVFGAASTRDGEAVAITRWILGWSHNPATAFVALRDAGHGTDMLSSDKRLQTSILDWFDARLKASPATAESPAAAPKPGPMEEFWTLLTSPGGFDRAFQLYDVERRRNPAVALFPESEMSAYGYRRLRAGHVDEAVDIFKVNANAYPRSPAAYDSLAEALIAAGQRREALEAAQKALKALAADRTIAPDVRALIRESIDGKIKELQ
jgi:dienelactone hydrolase